MALWLGAALASAAPVAADAQLKLRWEVQRSVFTADAPEGRSWSSFTLTNLAPQALPARGWAIYFNCIAGVETKDVQGPFVMERVAGTWYRLRPGPGFPGLPTGESTRLSFFHPEVMVKAAKAPTGPYIVFDDAPGIGHPIADYALVPLTRPQQWDRGPGDPMPVLTAQEVYRRNAGVADLPEDALPPVFPTPRQVDRRAGSLRLTSRPDVVGPPALRTEMASVGPLFEPYLGAAASGSGAPPVRLAIGPVEGQTSDEAYELVVDPVAGIAITGRTAAGVALGLQSLRELLPLRTGQHTGLTLRAMRIIDAPRFAYRGLQLDVARNFQPKATVLRLLDLMARYKLNRLHLHLTDDEGWRLEIPGLPELTEVGARRGHTRDSLDHLPPAYGSGPNVDDPHGSGYYSAADYIEILQHAARLHIDVIPEIEMPGHARAAVKSMESRALRLRAAGRKDADQYLLSDPQDESVYRSAQLYSDNVMNPGLESTYAFIDHVVDEIVALHRRAGVRLDTLHVGADELPEGAWERSPATRALMAREKLGTTGAVWDDFYGRVDRILRRHGLVASGWEELGARRVMQSGRARLIPNPVFARRGFRLYVWNDLDDAQDLAYRLANAGYDTVLTPATNLYFDMAYNQNPDEPGVNWAGTTDLQTVFDFVPLDFIRRSPTDPLSKPGMVALTPGGRRRTVGLEGTLFSETVRSRDLMDYLLMPRLLALAERAWAADPSWTRQRDPALAQRLHDRDWSIFVNELGKHVLPQLDEQFPGVQYRIAPPGLALSGDKVLANQQLPGFELRYTSDGSLPQADSPLVTGPIPATGVIQVSAFSRSGRHSAPARIECR